VGSGLKAKWDSREIEECFSPERQGNFLNNVNIQHSGSNASTNRHEKSKFRYEKTNKFNILYTNADCLTQIKKIELQEMILQQKIDIVAITEIFPKHSIIDYTQDTLYKIDGFDIFLSKTPGRGVAIYSKQELRANIVEDITNNFKESIWIEINLEEKDKLLMGCVYRSPNSNRDSVQLLIQMLSTKVNLKYSHFLTCGDFNLKNIDWNLVTSLNEENSIESIFVEGIKDLYLYQHVRYPTRYREGNVPSILDLVLTNEEDMVDAINYNTGIGKSDHLTLTFEYNCFIEIKTNSQTKLNFNKGKYAQVEKDLRSMQIDYDNESVQVSWSTFTEKLTKIIEQNIPKCAVRLQRRQNPYIDTETAKAIRDKKSKWIKYRHCKNHLTYNNFKIARNKVTDCIRKSKYKYEKNIAENAKQNPKLFWKYVRSKSKTITGINGMEINGEKTTDDKIIAEEFNRHFISVFTQENDQIPEPVFRAESEIEDTDINAEIITKLIQEINPNKSQGPDNIHPRLIKECKDSISKHLTHIFRKSLDEGILPTQWKQANVTAIFKAGKKTSVENYRPISVTPICCRLMEKIIRNTLVNHLEQNNILSKNQHGFRKAKSCSTQLLECIEEWTQSLDENHEVDIIYLDFKAAFDKVPHKRLLRKMLSLGIKGKLYKWIENFLTNRQQRVVTNGIESSWGPVTSGVPQGSVLGPVLFLIYINDLPEALDCTVKLFADDTKIYTNINTPSDEEKLQNNIFNACEWAIKWQMIFNVKKCKTMHIGKNEPSEYFMKDAEGKICKIQLVDSEKDLGVTFDDKLTFNKHIHLKVNIANRNLGLIAKSFTYLDKEMFLQLYKALVRPHLEYASVIWNPRYKKDIIAIENVQRRATRMMSNLKNLDYKNRLIHVGLPTMEYRRTRADVIQVYKLMNGIDKTSYDLLNVRDATTTRGHKQKLFKPRPRTNIRKNAFSHRVVNDWNSLPANVVEAPTLNSFKSRLNKHWVGPSKFEAQCYN